MNTLRFTGKNADKHNRLLKKVNDGTATASDRRKLIALIERVNPTRLYR